MISYISMKSKNVRAEKNMINLQKNEKNKEKQMKKFRLNKLFLASIAVFAITANLSAHAEFVVLDKDGGSSTSSTTVLSNTNTNNTNASTYSGASISNSSSNVAQVGTPDDSVNKPLKGFAKDLPLVTVLKQITPSGWVAKKDGPVDVNQTASWEGGSNWVDTLSQLAQNNNFSAIINWDKKELRILPKSSSSVSNINSNTHTFTSTTNTPIVQGGVSTTSTTTYETDKKVVTSSATPVVSNVKDSGSVFELADNNGNFAKHEEKSVVVANLPASTSHTTSSVAPTTVNTINGIKTTTTVISQPVVNGSTQAIQQTWVLVKGKTLRDNVQDWANKAGWHLAWLGSDYPVDVPATFTGAFDDENGPIAALSNAYSQADQPLIFDFKAANRTLVVKNYSLEQRFFKDKINLENAQ
jgi:hypothetical protein